MDSILQTLAMWQSEAIIVMALLACIALCYYASKGWILPDGPSFLLILGMSLAGLSALCYFVRPFQGLGICDHASFYIVLFLWCCFGMVFFAGKGTHPAKLLLAIALQAAILYALARYF